MTAVEKSISMKVMDTLTPLIVIVIATTKTEKVVLMECKKCGEEISLDGLPTRKLKQIINSGWFCKKCGTQHVWVPLTDATEESVNVFEKLFGG